MTAPSSQKAGVRPIGFALWDNARTRLAAPAIDLIIRPEELTRPYPSRNNVQQTLGGSWLDSFGEGLSTITIKGHTGWRGNKRTDDFGRNRGSDGLSLFLELRKTVFDQWHSLRKDAIAAGRNPDDIELIFSDHLDSFAAVVSPTNFTLRRHRGKPLISMYEISMVILRDVTDAVPAAADPITTAIANPKGRYRAARQALEANIADQRASAATAISDLGPIAGPTAKSLLGLSADVLDKVQTITDDTLGAVDEITAPLLTFALDLEQASRNAFQVLTAPLSVAAFRQYRLQQISGALNDAYCNLSNGFNLLRRYSDYTDVFGSSTCSSTGGGKVPSPLLDRNVFEDIVASSPQFDSDPLVSISPDASNAIATLRNDPLTLPANVAQISGLMGDIASGTKLAA